MPDDRRVLDGISRLVVDGTNVLYAIRRSPDPLPAAALIGRLRALVPPGVAVTVVLDGSPEHGLVARQIAAGVEVRYAGRSSADEFIAHLLDQHGPETAATLVVTDDIELSHLVRRSGARTAQTRWLIGRLDRQRLVAPAPGRPGLAAPASIGHGAPRGGSGRGAGSGTGSGTGSGAGQGSGQGSGQGDSEPPEPARWAPGRGATRKRGPAHRRPAGER